MSVFSLLGPSKTHPIAVPITDACAVKRHEASHRWILSIDGAISDLVSLVSLVSLVLGKHPPGKVPHLQIQKYSTAYRTWSFGKLVCNLASRIVLAGYVSYS
jgi:hypothetical protein